MLALLALDRHIHIWLDDAAKNKREAEGVFAAPRSRCLLCAVCQAGGEQRSNAEMCAGFIRKGEGSAQMSGAEGGSAGERRNNGKLTKRSKLASEQSQNKMPRLRAQLSLCSHTNASVPVSLCN